MATPAENKETVQRATDAFNELDREAFDPCYAEEVAVHGHGGVPSRGRPARRGVATLDRLHLYESLGVIDVPGA